MQQILKYLEIKDYLFFKVVYLVKKIKKERKKEKESKNIKL